MLTDIALDTLPYGVVGCSNVSVIDILASDHEVEEAVGFRGSQADSGICSASLTFREGMVSQYIGRIAPHMPVLSIRESVSQDKTQ
jgi:hypothetical protein